MSLRIIDTIDPELGFAGLRSLERVLLLPGLVARDALAVFSLSPLGGLVFNVTLYTGGTLVGSTVGINFSNGLSAPDSQHLIVNEVTGRIHSQIDGIIIGGGGNTVINEGLIDAFRAFVDEGIDSSFVNGGRIIASGQANVTRIMPVPTLPYVPDIAARAAARPR